MCLYKQASSDVTVSKNDEEEAKRGFTSGLMLPFGQGLLCVTTDQEFLFYSPSELTERSFQLKLDKRFVYFFIGQVDSLNFWLSWNMSIRIRSDEL